MARKKKSRKKGSSKGRSAKGKSAEGKPAQDAQAKKKGTSRKKRAPKKSGAEGADEVHGDPEAEDVPVVLDDDLADSDDVDALIAATVAGAAPEDHVQEAPAQPLDEVPDSLRPGTVVEDAAPGDSGFDAGEVSEDPAADEGVDLADAIDLGDVSSPEARDRLLAQALAHAEMQDARYRVPFTDPGHAGRWKAAAAAVLFVAAAAAGVAPPRWVRPEPPAAIDATARVLGIRQALLLQAQQVDAFRVRTQRLPDTLEELPARLPGVRYVRSGNRSFQLVAYERSGNAIVYDSASPASEFARLQTPWHRGGSQ